MDRLLYLQASPRGPRSYSSRVAQAFLQAYHKENPTDEILTLNVFEKQLPPFDGLAVQAKYTILHGKEHTDEELTAWRDVEALIEEFKSAQRYLLSVPMWNFSIPYRLKHYLDILVQPGYTFSYSPEAGYQGLVTSKPLCIIYSRGGTYPPGSEHEAFDLQKKYLETIFSFIGFTEIKSIIVEPTLMQGPEIAQQTLQHAIEQARTIAQNTTIEDT